MQVELIWLSNDTESIPVWELGPVQPALPTPASVARACLEIAPESDLVLFWDAALGLPNPAAIPACLETGGDVWHGGLALGMTGLPGALNVVNPAWRFTRDPAPDLIATSWRLSLRACLVRAEVIRQLGGPNAAFDSLTAAGLEMGHRWISEGALMRHVPDLLPIPSVDSSVEPTPLVDEFRFVRARFGGQWARWTVWRMWRNGVSLRDAWIAYQTSADLKTQPVTTHPHPLSLPDLDRDRVMSVSVLIPTLDRYPYLFTVLDQLREQTVPPLEIIVVDQTASSERDRTWPEQFADLPLQIIWQDEAGQCSSRNAGLQAAQGEAVLFLDDDDEIEPDLIERHLAFLQEYDVDGSVGVAEEVGAGALPSDFRFIRDSNVFTTNNSLLRREALYESSLFDLAYNRGARADGDLGMRLYLAGKLLVLNPMASVLHMHAPRGGLRQHKARVVTNASSRASLLERHFLSPTEAYLLSRYFTPQQVHEAVLIRTYSSLNTRYGGWRRLVRMVLMILLLPDTYLRNRRALEEGRHLLAQYPTIPTLKPNRLEEIL
ncbi:MAG: glycosyltransferase family A protein [Chloroflexota bacterium]